MTGYLTAADVIAEQFAALLAEDRADAENTCCAKCRRGTKQLGRFPCGVEGRCTCHTKGPTL